MLRVRPYNSLPLRRSDPNKIYSAILCLFTPVESIYCNGFRLYIGLHYYFGMNLHYNLLHQMLVVLLFPYQSRLGLSSQSKIILSVTALVNGHSAYLVYFWVHIEMSQISCLFSSTHIYWTTDTRLFCCEGLLKYTNFWYIQSILHQEIQVQPSFWVSRLLFLAL